MAKNPAGLSDSARVVEALARGDYIRVVGAVWGEKDKPSRLAWLREHAGWHAPLLGELALAEYVANPTDRTATEVAIPLITAAVCCIRLDAACLKDSSLSDMGTRIHLCYRMSLERAVSKYRIEGKGEAGLESFRTLCGSQSEDIETRTREKIHELKHHIEADGRLPSPEWLQGGSIHMMCRALGPLYGFDPDPTKAPTSALENDWKMARLNACSEYLNRAR